MVKMKSKIRMLIQARQLKRVFPEACLTTKFDKQLEFSSYLQSSPIGKKYKIKIIAHIDKPIRVFIKEPKKLDLAYGENKLPHVYSTVNQELCLFYPKFNEWSYSMLIVNTIIPWTMEWLFYYEIWLTTGRWLGKGIEH